MITKYSELEQVFRISHTDNKSSEITKKFANKSINFIIGKQNIDSNTNYFTLDFNKNNICLICVLIRDKKNITIPPSKQTHNNLSFKVVAKVEGYSGLGTENTQRVDSEGNIVHSTIFRPVDRNGNTTGISLETFGSVVDKDGKPIKISVQAVTMDTNNISVKGKKYVNKTTLH